MSLNPLTIGLAAIIASVGFKIFAQLMVKSRLNFHGAIPFYPRSLVVYIVRAGRDWQMVLGFLVLVLAGGLWFVALSRIPLSLAYPIGALAYPMIMFASFVFLGERATLRMFAGNLLIVAGIVVIGLGLR